jgi:hypothetical protein
MMIDIVLAIPAKALDPQKLISQFTHTSWTAKDGLPGPVRAIAQTLSLGSRASENKSSGPRCGPCVQAGMEAFGSGSVQAESASYAMAISRIIRTLTAYQTAAFCPL